MGLNTKIEWTDITVNFWMGCQKYSAGCKFCYMFRDKDRYGGNPNTVVRTKDNTFKAALKWKEPQKIFTCSWSDFFIEDADAWRADAWDVIRKTPHHKWQILTKRPERIKECLPSDWGDGWDNVWLGVSIENQKNLYRADILAGIPAKIRFISAEPLLGEIDFTKSDNIKKFHWVIIGGESGNDFGKHRYRPCEKVWIEKLISDFRSNTPDIKIFVKQLGTYAARKLRLKDNHGGNIDEWAENLNYLKIREFPA